MGPTASGKTSLAVQLAQQLQGEVISVDSALVYQGMDIGTAKPSLEERGGIPHHLIDILDPSESFSTGQFKSLAQDLISAIHQRGKLPILVGGTMLYFNALTSGLAVLPKADPAIRNKLDQDLQEKGKKALHQRLAEVDPAAALRIHPNDPQRVQRALEVYTISGRPISAFFGENTAPTLSYRPIKIVVAPTDRKILHDIIAQRFHNMLAQGLIEEVRALYKRGDLDTSLPALRAVGYRQVWSYLQGAYDFNTMTDKAIAATRQLAKRQFTWLRKETEVIPFNSDETALLPKVLTAIEQTMRK